jgi:2-polyprenyl-3-methyl-5-hydroxy-6-metoxy-1,4-benzoquinol methylase
VLYNLAVMTNRIFPNWHAIYAQQPAETMPWYYAGLDPDLESALAARGITSGRVLDLGTGPATQALVLAERGFDVTAADVSTHAVAQGRAQAAARGLRIEFIEDDVLASRLTADFDIVLDRGCYHVFAPELRPRYARTLAALVKPKGLFFLKCFSDEQPGEIGPYQSHPRDIEAVFQDAFEIASITRTIYQGTLAQPPKALFCTLVRR